MVIPFPVIIEAAQIVATKVLKNREERLESSRRISEIAGLLASNNEILIRDMEKVVARVAAEQKLLSCQSSLAKLSVFYREYVNNPDDQDKLDEVERECLATITTLDDPDIILPGVRTLLATISLRIDALVQKSERQPGDLLNAINFAEAAIGNIGRLTGEVFNVALFRVSPRDPQDVISVSFRPGEYGRNGNVSVPGLCSAVAEVKVDNEVVYKKKVEEFKIDYIPEDRNSDRPRDVCYNAIPSLMGTEPQDKWDEIQNDVGFNQTPLGEMNDCINEWKKFVDLARSSIQT